MSTADNRSVRSVRTGLSVLGATRRIEPAAASHGLMWIPGGYIASAHMDFNAVKGSTRAARRAGKYDAEITTGTNRRATSDSVLQSHGLTS